MTAILKKHGINIVIENNLFSKNKTNTKKETDVKPMRQRAEVSQQVHNPLNYQEPSYLSEIRNALAEKRFYSMKLNPRNSMYNNMNEMHSNALELIDKGGNLPINKPIQIDDVPEEEVSLMPPKENDDIESGDDDSEVIYFNANGDFLPTDAVNQRYEGNRRRALKNYTTFKVKPNVESLKKYGLPNDFRDDWDRKKLEFDAKKN